MGNSSTETPTAVELLRKIQKLEQDHALLKHQIISRLNNNSLSHAMETHYFNIIQSMGRTVYMFDLNNRIMFWNKMAETLYGYTPAEALGKTAPDIIISPRYAELASLIIQRAAKGETWSGQFPVRTKYGEKFAVITTLAPCCDHNGTIFGVTCVCADARLFRPSGCVTPPQRLDPHHPLQTPIISKIFNLANKVTSKMKTGEINTDHHSEFSPASSMLEQLTGKPTTDSNENTPGLHKVLSLKAEAWMSKKGISCPWKSNENRDTSDIRTSRFGWPWLHNDQEQESSSSNTKEAPGSLSCGTSSSWSTNGDSINKTDIHIENLDVEISWDDLIIGEEVGQGLRGTVYHALLYGSDVAVKIFTKQEYSDDVILSFRKEVCLMKRLRHPNILLFMGAVISPQYLCIVTELLPRGSLFKLLQRSTTQLDWRRRIYMAMDIARGMIYLHNCQPPIIHRNLKSSNLLVDKNWTLKVGDFGLSRIKHETYLKTNTRTGMPQWMAPEVLRNEQVDEKSDVYSYGVVLWEITTGKIPWENLNSMQVIGAVGFMDKRLEIPNDVDPQWGSLIESCWSREPESRPTFKEILSKLKDLQKKYSRAPAVCKKGS
ncbi:putative protein kinase TKL-CTR1-DRK-2 family [Helianthus anomalus]